MGKRLENNFDEMYDLSITDSRKRLYTIRDNVKNVFNKAGKSVKRGGIAAFLLGTMAVAGCNLNHPGPDPDPNPTPPSNTYTISGELDNEETHAPTPGVVLVYDQNKNKIDEIDTLTGYFSGKVNKNGLSSITLKAASGTYANPTSFWRTIDNLPAGNIDTTSPTADPRMNPAIRVVPNVADNTLYVNGIQIPASGSNGFTGFFNYIEGNNLRKYKISNVEVAQTNTDGAYFDSYPYTTRQDLLKQEITDLNSIISKAAEKNDVITTLTNPLTPIDPTNNDAPIIDPFNGGIGVSGYEVIIPAISSNANLNGAAGYTYNDLSRGTASLSYISSSTLPDIGFKGISLHELYLGLVAPNPNDGPNWNWDKNNYPGHYLTIFDPNFGPSYSTLISSTSIDDKAAKIIYEKTFQDGEPINNFLGTSP